MRFVNPKNDIAFKKIFGNEERKEILISFLNAVLDLSDDREIADLEILNPYQSPKVEALKYTLLDVQARDKRGVTFIVEMQLENVPGITKRFAYYTAKAYTAQLERGGDYRKLDRVIFIGILNFVTFRSKQYLTRHLILNTETHEQEIDAFEFVFIELPKFTKKKERELRGILEKWLYFLKRAPRLKAMPSLAADTQALQAAYEVANKFGWSREEMEVYDYWNLREQGERNAVKEARDEGRQAGHREGRQTGRREGRQAGREEGRQAGREEGRQEGEQVGLKKGREEERVETARKMLAKGYDAAEVAELTGLPPDAIAALSQEGAS
jgi:predicted transposase/invertase (TIGR01784 family)